MRSRIGKPHLRKRHHPNYHGGFVLDPDGHNVEVACHRSERPAGARPAARAGGRAARKPARRRSLAYPRVGMVKPEPLVGSSAGQRAVTALVRV